MAGSPRSTLEDSYLRNLSCAICGQSNLSVVHSSTLPDYVACSHCGAAFVAEDGGERVMYGKIPAAYPAAQRFALRQWAWLEAVARKAAPERPAAPSIVPHDAPEPVGDAPTPPFQGAWFNSTPAAVPAPSLSLAPPPAPAEGKAEEDAAVRVRLLQEREDDDYISAVPYLPGSRPEATPQNTQAEARMEEAAEAEGEPAPLLPSPGEPPPGTRYRVVLTGDRIEIPGSACAHCMRAPVVGRLTVIGQLARPSPTSRRQTVRVEVPLCADCNRRMAARSPAERSGRQQAHLISAVLGLGAIVAALGLRLIDLARDPVIGVFALLLVGVLGYALPAIVLVGRAARLPLPEDAVYVRTTLIIPAEVEGLAIAFEWRNSGYASVFHQANAGNTVGRVVEIRSPEL